MTQKVIELLVCLHTKIKQHTGSWIFSLKFEDINTNEYITRTPFDGTSNLNSLLFTSQTHHPPFELGRVQISNTFTYIFFLWQARGCNFYSKKVKRKNLGELRKLLQRSGKLITLVHSVCSLANVPEQEVCIFCDHRFHDCYIILHPCYKFWRILTNFGLVLSICSSKIGSGSGSNILDFRYMDPDPKFLIFYLRIWIQIWKRN